MSDFGFIILRHISTDLHSLYWREAVKSIRKIYTNERIIIIDDNSKIMTNWKEEEKEFNNISIIESEFPGAGEIYGYYYGWKYRPFTKFVVLHDSMFLKKKLPIIYKNAKFLWHFDKYLGGTADAYEKDTNYKFIEYLKPSIKSAVLDLYYDKESWTGCFGVSSVICIDFLDILFEKYGLLDAIKMVTCRHEREAMERIFALLCYLEDPSMKKRPSIYGNILTDYPGAYSINWEIYTQYLRNAPNQYNIYKIWSGR
jgi:hypothetical protein